MYLEPIHAVGLSPRAPTNLVKCQDGTFDVDNGIVAPCRTRGGVFGSKKPYDLVGTATNWSYPNCKAGYTKKSSGKPHPNAFTCF